MIFFLILMVALCKAGVNKTLIFWIVMCYLLKKDPTPSVASAK
jgi:hypothetical protein